MEKKFYHLSGHDYWHLTFCNPKEIKASYNFASYTSVKLKNKQPKHEGSVNPGGYDTSIHHEYFVEYCLVSLSHIKIIFIFQHISSFISLLKIICDHCNPASYADFSQSLF